MQFKEISGDMLEDQIPFIVYYDARLVELTPYVNSIEPGRTNALLFYDWSSKTQLFRYQKHYSE